MNIDVATAAWVDPVLPAYLVAATGLFVALCWVPSLWATFDAALKPDAAWRRADENKLLWALLPLVAAGLSGVGGAVAAYFYFTRVRPKVVPSLRRRLREAAEVA